MQLQTTCTSPESKFPNEYSDVIFIQIDQHLKKLLQKIQRGPDFMNHDVYAVTCLGPTQQQILCRSRNKTNVQNNNYFWEATIELP